MDCKQFLEDLQTVFAKHKLATLGTIRLSRIVEDEEFKPETLSVTYQKDNPLHSGITERGDFLLVNCDKIEAQPVAFESSSFQIHDREALIRGGVKSPLDDKVYYSRHEYDEHARRRGVELVGNDYATRMKARQERMAERAEKRKQAESN